VVVSLDDYYFSKSQRQQLAATVHPLLRWRGVPGTHHIERLAADLSAHLAGRPVAWPQFDKATDDCRADRPATSHSLLILEGWCLGALPQSDEALAIPVNRLEQQQDPDGRFRHYVNQQLAHWYQPLWPRFDALLFLAAPDWPTVLGWRQQQETALWQARGLGMSTTELQFFMQLFERYSRAMLAGQVQSGSCRLSLRADRTPLL
jgi:D-glycerate 3-kinase